MTNSLVIAGHIVRYHGPAVGPMQQISYDIAAIMPDGTERTFERQVPGWQRRTAVDVEAVPAGTGVVGIYTGESGDAWHGVVSWQFRELESYGDCTTPPPGNGGGTPPPPPPMVLPSAFSGAPGPTGTAPIPPGGA